MFTLAAHTSFGCKHWPDPAAWLEMVSQWKLDAVQFSFDLLDPGFPGAATVAAETGAVARAAGVRILSTFTGGRAYLTSMLLHPDARYRAWAREWWLDAVELTAALGAPATGGYFGSLPARCPPQRAAELTGILVDTLALEIGQAAATHGLEYLLIELMPGPGELPRSPEEARELLDRINASSPVPYYLCFDLGHACGETARSLGAGAVYAWLEDTLDLTRCLHLQQTDGLGDRHWPFAPPHDSLGVIDPDRVLDILRGSPLPQVDLVLELCHPPETSAAVVAGDWAASAEVWRQAMGRARSQARGGPCRA